MKALSRSCTPSKWQQHGRVASDARHGSRPVHVAANEAAGVDGQDQAIVAGQVAQCRPGRKESLDSEAHSLTCSAVTGRRFGHECDQILPLHDRGGTGGRSASPIFLSGHAAHPHVPSRRLHWARDDVTAS